MRLRIPGTIPHSFQETSVNIMKSLTTRLRFGDCEFYPQGGAEKSLKVLHIQLLNHLYHVLFPEVHLSSTFLTLLVIHFSSDDFHSLRYFLFLYTLQYDTFPAPVAYFPVRIYTLLSVSFSLLRPLHTLYNYCNTPFPSFYTYCTHFYARFPSVLTFVSSILYTSSPFSTQFYISFPLPCILLYPVFKTSFIQHFTFYRNFFQLFQKFLQRESHARFYILQKLFPIFSKVFSITENPGNSFQEV